MAQPYVAPPATNGFAIAALVLGIIGLCAPFGGILALIFGFIARKQIRESDQVGDGMAIAGIVLGFIGIAEILFFLAVIVTSSTTTS